MEKLAYRIPEAADLLGVKNDTVRKLISEGTLRCLRLGRAVRVPASELPRYVAEHTGEWQPHRPVAADRSEAE